MFSSLLLPNPLAMIHTWLDSGVQKESRQWEQLGLILIQAAEIEGANYANVILLSWVANEKTISN